MLHHSNLVVCHSHGERAVSFLQGGSDEFDTQPLEQTSSILTRFTASRLAPLDNRNFTMDMLPNSAAFMSGVQSSCAQNASQRKRLIDSHQQLPYRISGVHCSATLGTFSHFGFIA